MQPEVSPGVHRVGRLDLVLDFQQRLGGVGELPELERAVERAHFQLLGIVRAVDVEHDLLLRERRHHEADLAGGRFLSSLEART